MGGAARRQETRRRRGRNGGVGAARVHGDGPGGAGAEWSQTDEGGVAVHLAFFFHRPEGYMHTGSEGGRRGSRFPPPEHVYGSIYFPWEGGGGGEGEG